jgi:hypothetical protein
MGMKCVVDSVSEDGVKVLIAYEIVDERVICRNVRRMRSRRRMTREFDSGRVEPLPVNEERTRRASETVGPMGQRSKPGAPLGGL